MSAVGSGSDWDLGKSQSGNNLVSPLSSFVSVFDASQSLLDQSDSSGEGCGAPCLQNECDGPSLLHTLTGDGVLLSISIATKSVTSISGIMGLLTFIGLYLDLFDPLALILPGALFLGFLDAWEGRELKCVVIVPWQLCFISFSSW